MIVQKTRWLIQVFGVMLMLFICLSLHPTPSILGQSLIENATNQLKTALVQINPATEPQTLEQIRDQAQRALDALGGNLNAHAADIPLNEGSVRQHLINFWEQQSVEMVELINTHGPHLNLPVFHHELMTVVNVVLIRLGQAEHAAQMILLTKDAEAAQRYLQNLQRALQRAIGTHQNINEAGADFIEKTFSKVAHLSQAQWPSLFNFEKPSHQVASE